MLHENIMILFLVFLFIIVFQRILKKLKKSSFNSLNLYMIVYIFELHGIKRFDINYNRYFRSSNIV